MDFAAKLFRHSHYFGLKIFETRRFKWCIKCSPKTMSHKINTFIPIHNYSHVQHQRFQNSYIHYIEDPRKSWDTWVLSASMEGSALMILLLERTRMTEMPSTIFFSIMYYTSKNLTNKKEKEGSIHQVCHVDWQLDTTKIRNEKLKQMELKKKKKERRGHVKIIKCMESRKSSYLAGKKNTEFDWCNFEGMELGSVRTNKRKKIIKLEPNYL